MTALRHRVRRLWPLLACLLLFGLLVVLINPLHNFPMGDDWEYARSVQRLLTTGQFYRSPVVQATVFFPALWGALASWLLGFSFTTLRLSTLPLAAGTLAFFYLILGELGFEPARRMLGTLALMVTPLFVFNALSFMTDVPMLFWVVASLWCSLRAFRLGQVRWLLVGSVCTALAFLTRQLGLALAPAAALVVLLYRPRRDWPQWLAASLVVPVAATLGFYAWQAVARQTTWADSTITGAGTLEFIFNIDLPAALARRVVVMLVSVNLYLLPLWLAFGVNWRAAWQGFGRLSGWLRALAAVLVLFCLASITYFGARADWWPYTRGSLTNAGLWPALAYFAFPHDVRPPFVPEPFWAAMTYLGAVLGALFAFSLIVRVVDLPPPAPLFPANGAGIFDPHSARGSSTSKEGGRKKGIALADAWWRRLHALPPPRALIYISNLALLGLVLVYPLFVERYFLPFLPGAIILLLEATRELRPSFTLGGAALLVLGVFSVGLMWDYFDWHAARWANSQALVAQGLQLEKLDAGYEWTGWLLSDEAYAYINAHHVPVTADPIQYVVDPEYMVTFTPKPGYQVAQEWPFYSPFRWGGQDELLLLKRVPAAAGAADPKGTLRR